jgi:pyrimidine-nucleoside phosphorylase
MASIPELIRRKRDGEALGDDELRELVERYTAGDLPDYQMAAFLMAVYFQSMTGDELAVWTDAMLHSGEVLDMSSIPGAKVDKHSTGGVGDKVSIVLAPLAAAAGIRVPMISGRGLGHTGGTLDKLESIPGFDVDQSVADFKRLVEEVGAGLIGQTDRIAPADRELYALRDVTGTVECIPLIASSIMSKKLAEGIDGLVLDVKVGSGAFMKEIEEARALGRQMIEIGDSMDKDVRALVTDMDQPLGRAVGNALEISEAIDALRGGGPEDLVEVTVSLVVEMLDAAEGVDDRDAAYDRLRGMLEDGTALDKFREMVDAQDGDPDVCDAPDEVLAEADHVEAFEADRSGTIGDMDAEQIGLASVELGAGRMEKEDDIDPTVGLVFHRKRGDDVEAGEPILEIHYNDHSDVEACRERLSRSIEVVDGPVDERPLIFERLPQT